MLNKHDRARIDRLSQKNDEYHRQARDTDDPVKRDRLLVLAKRAEKTRQTQRTFPANVLLWGISVFLVLLPWALLKPAGYENLGVLGSTLVLALLVAIKLGLRSRHR